MLLLNFEISEKKKTKKRSKQDRFCIVFLQIYSAKVKFWHGVRKADISNLINCLRRMLTLKENKGTKRPTNEPTEDT